MSTYFQLLQHVTTEMHDTEQRFIHSQFASELCEMALCLLMLHTKANVRVATLTFPAEPALPISYVPLVDIYQEGITDFMLSIAARNAQGVDLSRGSAQSALYFEDALLAQGEPIEHYMISNNLLGLRPVPTVDAVLSLIYVPYIEVTDINASFPLDQSFEERFIRLVRCLLMLRVSNYTIAKQELERFLPDD